MLSVSISHDYCTYIFTLGKLITQYLCAFSSAVIHMHMNTCFQIQISFSLASYG